MEKMDVDPQEFDHVAVDENDCREIVLAYLVHNCFKETAETFLSCTGMKHASDYPIDIARRKPIYNYTLEGKALQAIELTNKLAPELLQKNQDLLFDLLTLHFIELVRHRKCTEALEFAKNKLSEYGRMNGYVERLEDCMTLLAYEEPEKSPMFSLLTLEHRQGVADSLNQAILANSNLPSYTAMERIVQQLTVVRQKLHEENGKDGQSLFSLSAFLKN